MLNYSAIRHDLNEGEVMKGSKYFRVLGRLGIGLLSVLFLASCMSTTELETPTGPPSCPSGLQAQVTDNGVRVTWDNVPGATHYTVFWGHERGSFRNLANTVSCAVSIPGLTDGNMYYFSVTAWNTKGESGYAEPSIVVYDRDPANAKRYLAKGTERFSEGLKDDAMAYLSAAIRLDPGDPSAYEARARLFLDEDVPRLAEADLLKAERARKLRKLSARVERTEKSEQQ
jgi:hypothetical protein